MKTLLPERYNWPAFIFAGILIKLIFYSISWYSFFAIMVSIYVFTLLFDSIGTILPTRHLLGSFMCVQFFIGPMFAYNGLDEYQYFLYKMKIPEAEYFSYALPAVLLFIIGLHLNAGKYRGEKLDIIQIKGFVEKNKTLPYLLIIFGFISSIIASYFSAEFAFLFYLLGGLKFIGLFLLVLGSEKLNIGLTVLVLGSIISSSFGSGMFHDLLTWIIYSIAVFGIKYKLNLRIKIIGLSAFIFIVSILQILKGTYRETTNKKGEEANVETFAKIYQKENEEKGVLSFINLAKSNVRINQGFIITNIMSTVPDKVEYSNGEELYQIIEAAIMPRILAPDKLNAGDRSIFTKYSGIPLTEGTSMGLSSLGDAYINFGVFGGIIFMFLLGCLYNYILVLFNKYTYHYPSLLIFVPLVFYYPIRPDCELQTILGHLVKSCFLIFVIIQFWKPIFKSRNEIQFDSL